MNARSLVLVGALLGLLGGSAGEALKLKKTRPPVPDHGWGRIITNEDRDRLRQWRVAWVDGVTQAQGEGFARDLAKEKTLLDPDAARDKPDIPDGQYHCRTIKLGRKNSLGKAFRIEPIADCRMRGGRFRVTSGIQRVVGNLWPYDGTRQLLLGTVQLSDERASIPYGRDKERDLLGMLDKVGPNRWRLALPHPSWESQIDVIEITPAD